jgi:hypothetical protein
MSGTVAPPAQEDAKGLRRLASGAALGLAAAIVGVVLPITFLLLATYNPGGFFTLGALLIETTTILVVAGAILFLMSLLTYRIGFATLRKVDRRFTAASGLCIVGSLGFLLIVVAALLLLGSAGSLATCVQKEPSHMLTCIRSGQTLGTYTALAGFWLGWLGGLGLVLGITLAGGRFSRKALYGGASLYAVLLLVLLGPFVDLLRPIPFVGYLFVVAPILTIFAPAFVFAGSFPPPRPPPQGWTST